MFFWMGVTASSMGSQTLAVAYPLLAMALTGSPLQAGWVAFALTIPGLFCYLPGGILIDRVDRRSIMVITEALRGTAVVSVVVALLLGVATVPHLLVAAALEGTLWVLYSLAEAALIPTVTKSRTGLLGALVGSETSAHLAVLTGRPLGGFLYGLGQAIPFAVNSLLFLISLTSVLLLPGRARRRRDKVIVPWPEPSTKVEIRHVRREASGGLEEPGLRGSRTKIRLLWREMADGLRELRRHRFLRQAIQVTAVTNMAVNALIMIFIATSESMSAWEVGLVLAAGGVGGFAGTWIFLPLAPRLVSSPGLILGLQTWVWVIAFIIAAFAPEPLNYGLATLATGCAGAMSNITLREFEARHVAPARLARVVSISRLVSRSAMSLAAPIGGVLVVVMTTKWAILTLLTVAAALALTVTVQQRAEIVNVWSTLSAPASGAEDLRTPPRGTAQDRLPGARPGPATVPFPGQSPITLDG
jgi:MFS family permease